jgi:amino acid adenylation domain-containing protein
MIKNVLQLLEDTADRLPNKIALKDENKSITFKQYVNEAKSIGSFLNQQVKDKYPRPIIVVVERRVEPIIAFMGVLYSGNFYVPVDNRTPIERLRNIIEVINPMAVIGFSIKEKYLFASINEDISFHLYEEISNGNEDTDALLEVRSKSIDVDPLYAIFTSGSTGVPKAVVINHKSVIDLSSWLTETFSFDDTDVIGNQTPFYFDASVKDIYTSLRTGATFLVISPKCFLFPKLLIETLVQNDVTTILWATSAVVLTAKSGILEESELPNLKRIFFAGETMYGKHLNIWKKFFPSCTYINLYGPTEVTVDSTYYIVNREFNDNEVIPIGINCDNKAIFLLDKADEVIFGNVEGELAVRGTGVALGYYNNKEQTDQVFIQNPLHNHYKDLIYKTGDFVRRNTLGEIEFIGRKDFQIKHMGNRIELGEIEAVVYGLTDVKHAACVYDTNKEKIVLYYTADFEISPKVFLNELSNNLPKYMFPNRFEHIEEMPLNANGKVDKNIIKARLNEES